MGEDDRRAICEVLATIAADLGYTETDEVKTPDTLASYRRSIRRSRMWLTAWTAGRTAVVRVSFLTPSTFAFGQVREHMRVRDRVEQDLRARFGDRVRRMPRSE